jgi:hypothetical protein
MQELKEEVTARALEGIKNINAAGSGMVRGKHDV